MNNIRKISNKRIYVTILCDDACVGDYFLLTKDKRNRYDEEAIAACYYDIKRARINEKSILINDDYNFSQRNCYVANSVNTVAYGTYSSGRIYDKFNKKLIVKTKFALKRAAICEVVGEPIDKKPAKKAKK